MLQKLLVEKKTSSHWVTKIIWVFPKIGVPPNHPILIGFSLIFTIHFGVPLFLETPNYLLVT